MIFLNTSEGFVSRPWQVLLKYARVASVNVEVLIDDELQLQSNLQQDPSARPQLRKYCRFVRTGITPRA
jgi:hypothetical protein